jgi:hypothetical protein
MTFPLNLATTWTPESAASRNAAERLLPQSFYFSPSFHSVKPSQNPEKIT